MVQKIPLHAKLFDKLNAISVQMNKPLVKESTNTNQDLVIRSLQDQINSLQDQINSLQEQFKSKPEEYPRRSTQSYNKNRSHPYSQNSNKP